MENKLTDEEIVKALECCMRNEEENSWAYCAGCPVGGCENEDIVENTDYLVRGAIDLIHRLQDENKRLTEENGELEKTVNDMSWVIKIHKYCVGANHCQNRSDGEFELQKQVDELEEQLNYEKNYEKGVMIMKNENELMNEIKEQCGACEAWSGTDCTRNPYTQGCLKDEKQVIECHGMLKGCDMVKQAVKDTAREICNLILEYWQGHDLVECDWLRVAISEKYGVEVE